MKQICLRIYIRIYIYIHVYMHTFFSFIGIGTCGSKTDFANVISTLKYIKFSHIDTVL